MTKVTILGETQGAEPEKKKIEFKVNVDMPSKSVDCVPSDWDNVQLIARNYIDGYDLFAVWNDVAKISRGFYYGHFNDGIV